MKKPNTIEAELNEIRVQYYEATKGMTPKEEIAYVRAQVVPIHKQFNIHAVSRADITAHRAKATERVSA
ncbi:MAG: hypothetical protein LBP21_01900 [Synergistaceae bacterium]|jgi:hypothetical protein|nr:hypothetical protein [Synergistaceae bacterium]